MVSCWAVVNVLRMNLNLEATVRKQAEEYVTIDLFLRERLLFSLKAFEEPAEAL